MGIQSNPKKNKIGAKAFSALIGIILLVIGIYYITSPSPESSPLSDSFTDQSKQLAWVERGKDAIRQRLKDPDSAQFGVVGFVKKEGMPPLVCGQVNAKNSFGGFNGFKYFITDTDPDRTYLQNDMRGKEFATLWNKLCVR